jgi:hypothetical protein
MVLVEFGGKAVKTYPLTIEDNLICIILGSGELLWHMVIKLMPVKYFQLWSLDKKAEEQEASEE